ncbi:MAG: gamma-glutamyltransferase, partial [Pseudomonadota bacterium]
LEIHGATVVHRLAGRLRGAAVTNTRCVARFLQGHVQIIVNMLDFGMNLQEAGDAARIRHGGSSQPTGQSMDDGGTVYLENGFDPAVIKKLEDMGHKFGRSAGSFGGYQAIFYDEEQGVYYGASEVRKDGAAAGY